MFKYSPRKGTPASKYINQVDGNIKHERSEKLINLGEELSIKFNKNLLGKTMEVLFEEESKESKFYRRLYYKLCKG